MGGKEISVKFILLVEDNDFSAKLIMSLLMHIPSYFVVHVRDSCGALEIFQEVLPDLLLLDYQLPLMNGIELYDLLFETKGFRKVPVIVLSSLVAQPDIRQSIEARHIQMLPKPVEKNVFIPLVEQLMAQAENVQI
jgi:CheY-like chemotaxis protein